MRVSKRWWAAVAGAAWLGACAAGFAGLLRYEHAPGRSGEAAGRWPPESRLARPSGRPMLVVAVHPRCPCTSATVEELARILARCRGRLSAAVLFYCPDEESEDWVRTGLWDAVAALPGVRALCDRGGIEARRFGALTSGHAVLYDGEGRLRFTGGITGSRGHAGDNPGQAAVVSVLISGKPDFARTPVFGCALFAESCEGGR